MKKNYLVMLVISVAALFGLFVFILATPSSVQLSPGAEGFGLLGTLSTVAAFVMGVLIVLIAALLVLVGVEK